MNYAWEMDDNGDRLTTVELPEPNLLRTLLGNDFFDDATYAVLRSDDEMRRLGGLPRLQYLELGQPEVTDAGLRHLKGLSRLQQLSISCTSITDSGLQNLKGLSRLESLTIDEQITDRGLEELARLSQLQALCLRSSHITDAGILKHFDGLHRLKCLGLRDSHVTDSGLQHSLRFRSCPSCRDYF